MSAGLHHAAAAEHDDAIGHPHGREAVRDQHRRPAATEVLEALEHFVLGAGIERGGRLVEDQHVRVPHVGPRDRDLLPFAPGQVDAVVETPAERLLVAQRQAVDETVGQTARRRFVDARAVLAVVDAPDADVVGRREMEADEILEDHADAGPELRKVVVAQVAPVEQHTTLGRIVEPGQQLDDRGLAGAVLADQRHDLARWSARSRWRTAQALGAGVAVAHILEHEALADGVRHRERRCRRDDTRSRVRRT